MNSTNLSKSWKSGLFFWNIAALLKLCLRLNTVLFEVTVEVVVLDQLYLSFPVWELHLRSMSNVAGVLFARWPRRCLTWLSAFCRKSVSATGPRFISLLHLDLSLFATWGTTLTFNYECTETYLKIYSSLYVTLVFPMACVDICGSSSTPGGRNWSHPWDGGQNSERHVQSGVCWRFDHNKFAILSVGRQKKKNHQNKIQVCLTDLDELVEKQVKTLRQV